LLDERQGERRRRGAVAAVSPATGAGAVRAREPAEVLDEAHPHTATMAMNRLSTSAIMSRAGGVQGEMVALMTLVTSAFEPLVNVNAGRGLTATLGVSVTDLPLRATETMPGAARA